MTQTLVITAPMPVKHDLRMKTGADWRMTIRLKEDDRVTIRNTTGYTCVMNIKASQNGETYASLSIGSGITNTPAQGKLVFVIPAATINTYDFVHAVYEIIITDASSNKTCPFVGDVELL